MGEPQKRGGDELTALYHMASLSREDGDRDDLIASAMRIVGEAVECERVVLLAHDELTDSFRIYSSDTTGGERLALTDAGIFGRVFGTGQPEIVHDVFIDPDALMPSQHLDGVRQMIVAPLKVGGKTRGVLAGANSVRGAFNDRDLRAITVVGDRIAITLENTDLVQALQRQVQELDGLQRLSKLLTFTDSLERVIGASLRIVMDLVACEKIAVLLYDEDSDSLVGQRPVIGMTEDQIAALQIPMSEPTLGGTVFRTGTALMSNDAPNDKWVSARFRNLLDMKSVAAVPLLTSGRAIGIIEAVNAVKGSFDDRDIDFLSLLGAQVGAVIEATIARQREKGLVRQLRETDRTKSEFVSMLAHELKGPMTTLVGFGDTMTAQWENLEDGRRREIAGIMAKEASRLSRLVNDLLDVSRMEAGTLRYDLEPMPLSDLVESILEVHVSLKREHEIESRISSDLPKVNGDRDRIRQVFLNLLTNATRYSPAGTRITLSAEVVEGGECVQVSVSDEGLGISDDDKDRIFTKFAMLPKPAWVKKGTGLGLYITKAIVDAHGGRIWVESNRGRGTTFHFTLRVAGDLARSNFP